MTRYPIYQDAVNDMAMGIRNWEVIDERGKVVVGAVALVMFRKDCDILCSKGLRDERTKSATLM